MKGGDLSNEAAPWMAIRFERVIRTEEGKANRAAKAFLQSTLKLDVNALVLTTGDRRKAMGFMAKWGIPFSRVEQATHSEIPQICWENNILTYYDVDTQMLQNVRSRGKERTKAEQWTQVEVI